MMERFEDTIKAAKVECEGGMEYVVAEDGIQDNFYFRFDFATDEVGMCSSHKLTEDQRQTLIDLMAEEITTAPEADDSFPDYAKEYGINNEMFIQNN